MPRSYARVVALVCIAAIGWWLAIRGRRPAVAVTDSDDDAAAEIIRRALPSLERARTIAISG